MRSILSKHGEASHAGGREKGAARQSGRTKKAVSRPGSGGSDTAVSPEGRDRRVEILPDAHRSVAQAVQTGPAPRAPVDPPASGVAGIAILSSPDPAPNFGRAQPPNMGSSNLEAASGPMLRAHHNGQRKVYSVPKIWRLVWKCNYAWLRIPDFYRWSIEGHEDSAYVCVKVPPLPRRFGLLMHMRGSRAMTPSDYVQLEELDEDVTNSKFHQLASRFNKVFGDLPEHLRPFFYYRYDEPGSSPKPAYRMHPERDRLLVMGVAPGQGLTDDDIDWTLFLTPPPANAPSV